MSIIAPVASLASPPYHRMEIPRRWISMASLALSWPSSGHACSASTRKIEASTRELAVVQPRCAVEKLEALGKSRGEPPELLAAPFVPEGFRPFVPPGDRSPADRFDHENASSVAARSDGRLESPGACWTVELVHDERQEDTFAPLAERLSR